MLGFHLATPRKDLTHGEGFAEEPLLISSWVGRVGRNEVTLSSLSTVVAVSGKEDQHPIVSLIPVSIYEFLKV